MTEAAAEPAVPAAEASDLAGGGPVVWCDFGGVLTSSVAKAFTRVATAAKVPPVVLYEAVDEVAAGYGLTELGPLELGLVSERDWGAQVRAALAPAWVPEIDFGRLGEYWYAGHSAEHALLSRLAELPAGGVRLGLLTNGIREWEPHRRALLPAAASVFEIMINSCEVGVRKPDAAIYELAERAFGQPGADCLLIDDVERNCAAATRRGWSAIHHVSADLTIARLDAWLADRLGRSERPE